MSQQSCQVGRPGSASMQIPSGCCDAPGAQSTSCARHAGNTTAAGRVRLVKHLWCVHMQQHKHTCLNHGLCLWLYNTQPGCIDAASMLRARKSGHECNGHGLAMHNVTPQQATDTWPTYLHQQQVIKGLEHVDGRLWMVTTTCGRGRSPGTALITIAAARASSPAGSSSSSSTGNLWTSQTAPGSLLCVSTLAYIYPQHGDSDT